MSRIVPSLDYARRRPRPRWLRLGAAIIFVAAILCAARSSRVRAWRAQLIFLYWQHECLTWALPHRTVVYEEDQERAKALLAKRGTYAPVGDGDYPPVEWPAGYAPPIGYAPPECVKRIWDNHCFPTILFVHQLRLRDEPSRLVLVDAHVEDVTSATSGRTLVLWARSQIPGTTEFHAEWTPVSGVSIPLKNSDVLRLFAGTADTSHPDHFRIEYELNGSPGVLGGHLLKSGEFKWSIESGTLHIVQ